MKKSSACLDSHSYQEWLSKIKTANTPFHFILDPLVDKVTKLVCAIVSTMATQEPMIVM